MALLLLLSGAVGATTYLDLDLEQMLERTEVAFYGEVSNQRVEARDGEPWTVVTFRVLEPLTSEVAEEMELAFLGGTLPDGTSLTVNLMPQFRIGETVLVLAYRRELVSPIVGFRQGLWRLQDGNLTDARGRRLGLDEAGELLLDGPGGDPAAILPVLRQALEDTP